MTASWWVLAGCVLAGAMAAAWPDAGAPPRLRPARRWLRAGLTAFDPAVVRARLTAVAGRPRAAVALVALFAAVAGLLVSGLVAGLLAAIYSTLGARGLVRRVVRSRAGSARARSLDELCALAADLRAGLVLEEAPTPTPATGRPERRIAELTAAVWRLAGRTGAPAAELVERIEADARAGDRARASAAAQAAGARATALLLAALPVGGIALGYGIGVDPLEILLHTPLGGGCALGAALLQVVGLLWADRLSTGPVR